MAATDPFFNQTGLVAVNDNAADGSSTFIDQSGSAKTISNVGTATYSSATAPTGMTTSGLMNSGGTKYLSIADSADFDFGAGDFTLEGYINPSSVASAACVWGQRTGLATEFSWLIYRSTTTLQAYLAASPNAYSIWNAGTIGTVATGTWYHFAVTRFGSALATYLAGVNGATATSALTFNNSGVAATIGANVNSGETFAGNVDSFRITKGVARYVGTGSFTPPALPLPITTSVLFDAKANSGDKVATASYTVAITVGSGSNRGLLACVALLSGIASTVTSISSDIGGEFTLIRSDTNGVARSEIWELVAPASGAHTVTVTLSAGINSATELVSLAGVNQTSMNDANNGGTGTGANVSTTVTSSTDQSWVVDCVATSDTTIANGAAQTPLVNFQGTSGTLAVSGQQITTSPAGAVAQTWSGIGIADIWAQSVVAIKPFVAQPAPVSDFSATPLSGNAQLSVQFTDLSTNAPTSWAWTFGDAATSTAQNPSHSYAAAGTYSVGLTATNAGGSDLETKTDYITVTAPVVVQGGGDSSRRKKKNKWRKIIKRADYYTEDEYQTALAGMLVPMRPTVIAPAPVAAMPPEPDDDDEDEAILNAVIMRLYH